MGPNSSLQNRLVKWGVPPLYKLWSSFLSNWCGTKSSPSKTSQHKATRGRSQLRWNYQPTPHVRGGISNTPPHAQTQWAWNVAMRNPDNGRSWIGSDTMLKLLYNLSDFFQWKRCSFYRREYN